MSIAKTAFVSTLMLTVSLVSGGPGISAHNVSHPEPVISAAKRSDSMKINIKIDRKIVTATLADNVTARDFLSLLPLKISMNDLFGREKYGDLPKALSENGPRQNRYEVGDIGYWSPDHQFAVYYLQDGKSIPSPGIIPIAKIDTGAEAFNAPGSVNVIIEPAK